MTWCRRRLLGVILAKDCNRLNGDIVHIVYGLKGGMSLYLSSMLSRLVGESGPQLLPSGITYRIR